MTANREEWVDWLKGLAILCVVVGHAAEGAPQYGSAQWMHTLHMLIYAFHMPLFFFLSGYTFELSRKKKDKRSQWMSVLEILLLYIFWSGVMYIGKSALPGVANVVYNTSFVYCLFFAPVAPYWYLAVLSIYRILLLILSNNKGGGGILLLVSIVCGAVVPVLTQEGREFAYLCRIMYHFVFFLGGMKFSQMGNKKMSYARKACALILPAAFAAVIFDAQTKTVPFVKMIVGWIIIISLVGVADIVSKRYNGKIIVLMGKYSLYIYLLHNYFTVINRVAYQKTGVCINPVAYLILNVAISIGACMVICIIAQKFAFVRLFFSPVKILSQRKRNGTKCI